MLKLQKSIVIKAITMQTITNILIQRRRRTNLFLSVRNIRQLLRTTAKVAVLWITAAHSGLIRPSAPSSIAAEFTKMVAIKF